MKKEQVAAPQMNVRRAFETQNPIHRLFFLLALTLLFCGFESCCKDDCPEGFEGKNCDQEIAPSQINILEMRVLQFPATQQNGNAWDQTLEGVEQRADLKIQIWETVNGVSTSMIGETFVKENVFSGTTTTHVFNLQGGHLISLSNPTSTYRAILMDNDGSVSANDDLMIGKFFTPYAAGEGFPEQITLTGTELILELQLKYHWD